jgi:transketolase
MLENPLIWVVTGDLGYGMFDKIRQDFPDRFINTGSAEQCMMGIACGLSLEGKIPFVYSITPFLLYRPFETIRTYVDHEKLNIKLIGGGRDSDYAHDGFSHYAGDDKKILKAFKNIQQCWPQEENDLPEILDNMIKYHRPCYLNLSR